ncbi:aminotransferase class V-fold PLP-dependent enzyme [Xenorhabdus sp. PB30.3]|uniref:aminotransferase class V-fold PLP-dependent enzyme n=1 Tax=Xenorhabdus sp. PB30.3 TaxID=2788941 RepID=UPI001E4B56C3|nr:aminotransferase class V-fold PLP-dependent enzyme [Xenorhabdus sp. PB30.3]MCC8380393.1 aminotransferase class V-fold PLP-dependent enzyme [Xenorhabdus sp. PB30.3]
MTNHFIERSQFPALMQEIDGRPLNYLDSAATTLKPRVMIDAVTEYYSQNGANIHRGKHRLSDEASNAYEATRHSVADYISAQANEVVFTHNTTHALNIVAQGLELRKSDLVIAGIDSHHSQLLPWRQVATLRFIQTDDHGRIDLDHFQTLLAQRPKVVALTHCSNVTGVVHPIERMIEMIRTQSDAVIVLDAAQSLPHGCLNLHTLGADFVAFSAHKMLGPTGLGFLYANRHLLDALKPLQFGGGTVDWVDADGQVNRRAPYHLEAGTPAIASVIGAGATFHLLAGFDETARREHDRGLVNALLSGAASRPYLKLIGPADSENRHAIGAFKFSDCVSVGEIARLLSDAYGIMCRSGYLCAQPFVGALAGGEILRASAYLYNTTADIDALYQALDDLAECIGLPTIN